MRKDEQAIMNKLVQVAESYNIDVGITHNKTDAEYCADKIATIREVASVLGITTDIVQRDNQISTVYVGGNRTDLKHVSE